MAYENNNNNTNNGDVSQPLLQQQQITYPSYQQQPQQQQQPQLQQQPQPQYIFVPPSYSPLYYQPQQPNTLIVNGGESSHCSTSKCNFFDSTGGAAAVFILGFFFPLLWMTCGAFIRSANRTAKILGIFSAIFFIMTFTFIIVLLTVIIPSVTYNEYAGYCYNNYYYSSSSSYNSSSNY